MRHLSPPILHRLPSRLLIEHSIPSSIPFRFTLSLPNQLHFCFLRLKDSLSVSHSPFYVSLSLSLRFLNVCCELLDKFCID